MTTGRINQVTIVRRGWPTGACFSAGEIFQVTGGRPRARRAAVLPAPEGRRAPLAAVRFPPLSSPGPPSAAPHPLWAVRLGGPRRRTQRAASTIAVSAARGCPLSLCVQRSPAASSPQNPSVGGRRRCLQPPKGSPSTP